tara:strand:+ start:13859 stop:14290 length:432 start_codon:yes stop_codon:yes gene_type:complete
MHYNTEKPKFTVYTLIDITDTKITTPKQQPKKFYQAQNLNSFLQTISLRVQPNVISTKCLGNKDLKNYNFGTAFKKRKVWTIEFDCDTSSPYQKNDNPVYFLQQDFHNLPIHVGLNENLKEVEPVVDTFNKDIINTYFTFDQQ